MSLWISIKQQFSRDYPRLAFKLKHGFLTKGSHKDSPSLLKNTIIRQMNGLLAKQFVDARNKKDNLDYWGHTGWYVEQAADGCKSIIKWQDEESLECYFERVLPAMANLAEAFRNNPYDEAGYGLGTVRVIENALIVKARVCKQIP